MRFGGGSSRGKGGRVKRALIGAGLIVALAFPATIIANIRHFEGTVDEGGTDPAS